LLYNTKVEQLKEIPDVTVVVHTYNQETYISQCIDSILMQKSISRIKILIIDDASTDGTIKICENYQFKFPKTIELVALETNELSQGFFVGRNTYLKIDTKYIAWCDGDDYWTDELRIEKQISVFEGNSKIAIVHTNYLVLQTNTQDDVPETRASFEIERALEFNQGKKLIARNLIKQSTALILRDKIDFNFVGSAHGIYACDWLICVSAAQSNDIHFLTEITAVVRVTNTGIWSGAAREKNASQKALVRWHCAANLPESELRELFRKRVVIDWIRDCIANSNIYKVVRPFVLLTRLLKLTVKRWT